MTERDLQRWSREVAEDPGAPSFVRLARAYRRGGRAEAARDVVTAGLGVNPEHVDAHALLALLHIEDGDREQARDEWETVLRLDPGNFDASRGLGFLALERGDLDVARRHLDAAAHARPEDPAVSKAREVLDRREREAAPGLAPTTATHRGSPTPPPTSPGSPAPSPATPGPSTPSPTTPDPTTPDLTTPDLTTPDPTTPEAAPAPAPPPGPAASGRVDPVALFSPLTGDSPFRGALVLDEQGLVLAGQLEDDDRRDELLGGLLNTVVAEAQRTTDMLRLGDWRQMLLETGDATLHVTALGGGAVVVVVAERGAPAGWVVRVAGRARVLADRFLGEGR